MFFKRNTQGKNSKASKAKRPVESKTARVITSKSWLPVNQLELGMYVEELDKPWEQTSFMFQGFIIDSYETLKAVKNCCQYASVRTQKPAASRRLIS